MTWERKIQKKSAWNSAPVEKSIFPKQRGSQRDNSTNDASPTGISKGHGFNLLNLKTYPDSPSPVQAKLTVGAPGDKYEQEADAMAAQVMSMPEPATSVPVQREMAPDEQEEELQTKPLADSITSLVQREAMPEEEQEIQTKPLNTSIQRDILPEEEAVQMKPALQRTGDGSFDASSTLESRLSSSKGGGSPLPDAVRGFMEPRFGNKFDNVRVHTGSEAVQMNKELGAQAFTHGSDIYYGAGKAPGNNELTAHELTHVVQQNTDIASGSGHHQAASVNENSTAEVSRDMPSFLQSPAGLASFTQVSVQCKKATEEEINSLKKAKPYSYDAKNRIEDSYQSIKNYRDEGIKSVKSIELSMKNLLIKYEKAYQSHKLIIEKVNAELEDEKKFADNVVGVVIAVFVGATLGVGLEAQTLIKLSLVTKEAVTELGEIKVGEVKESLIPSQQPYEKSEQTPLEKTVKYFEVLLNLKDELLKMSQVLEPFHDGSVAATQTYERINAYITGGEPEEPVQSLLNRISPLLNCATLADEATTVSKEGLQKINKLETEVVTSVNKTSEQDMERELWISWCTQHEPDHRIFPYLKKIGLIGLGKSIIPINPKGHEYGGFLQPVPNQDIQHAAVDLIEVKALVGQVGVIQSTTPYTVQINGKTYYPMLQNRNHLLQPGEKVEIVGAAMVKKSKKTVVDKPAVAVPIVRPAIQ